MNRYFGEPKPSPEELFHYGVKGMKWGVRKSDDPKPKPYIKEKTESRTVTLKNGDTLTLDGDRVPALTRLIAKMSSSARETVNKSSNFTIKDSKGGVVGQMELVRESPTSLNVVWVGIDDSARGKGYATAAMKSAIDHAREQKLKTVTLEVPGHSPDARHIYEKLGFKEVEVLSTPDEDFFWGGLTAMRLDLNDRLAHYGVKGMKWGVRKSDSSSSTSKSEDLHVKLKNGDEITLNSKPSGLMTKLIDRLMPGRTKENFRRQNFHIKDKDGNRVGEMYLFSESPETLHVAWIGVKDKHRGHGYATASMKAAVDNARQKGYKSVTLQAVDESEDAVHIYKKMGFKEDHSKGDPVPGLTDMRLDLEDKSLAHYGVKGMKWGVRKDDPYRSTESKALRKESRRNLDNYMWQAVADDPIFGKTMTKEEYKALSAKGETFIKNTTFRRITPNSEAALKGNTYVSTLKKDSDFYKAAIPAVGPNTKGLGGGGRKAYKQAHYEITMKATKKLSSPSEKERVDAFIELLEEPAVQMKGRKSPITGRAYLERIGFRPVFGRYETEELAFKAWDGFTQMQGDQDNPLAKAYFEKIKSRGYNAIVDDNDAGRYTKKPLVLLDPESTVQIKDVKRLSADEINQAQRRLKVEV